MMSLGGGPGTVGGGSKVSHDIKYNIQGNDLQMVEIILDPGFRCIAECGAMVYLEDELELSTQFSDGSKEAKGEKEGIFGKFAAAGKRWMAGESVSITHIENKGMMPRTVGFSAPYPGTVVPLDLGKYDNELKCNASAFLCASFGTSIGIAFQKKLRAGFFGGAGFILQKLQGDGLCFVHGGGHVQPKVLEAGRKLRVDTGCVLAFTKDVTFDIQKVGGLKSMFLGGEGWFFASLTGPGTVWIQSLPFERLAARILSEAPQGDDCDGGSHSSGGDVAGAVFGEG